MLIISPIKSEGVFNLDKICQMQVKKLVSDDGETTYSILISGEPALPKFMGQWETRAKAEEALEEIIKAHHCGNKEVYLD